MKTNGKIKTTWEKLYMKHVAHDKTVFLYAVLICKHSCYVIVRNERSVLIIALPQEFRLYGACYSIRLHIRP